MCAWSALSRFPDLFAAAAPIAGGGNAKDVCKAKNVAIRAYHGDSDNVISHGKSAEMIEALKACGAKAELITYKGVNHGSWPITYRDPEFYQWLLSNSK
ncbi:MAG: dienelactone hydrolase family protein [Cyclobacteriaceae bacterium]